MLIPAAILASRQAGRLLSGSSHMRARDNPSARRCFCVTRTRGNGRCDGMKIRVPHDLLLHGLQTIRRLSAGLFPVSVMIRTEKIDFENVGQCRSIFGALFRWIFGAISVGPVGYGVVVRVFRSAGGRPTCPFAEHLKSGLLACPARGTQGAGAASIRLSGSDWPAFLRNAATSAEIRYGTDKTPIKIR